MISDHYYGWYKNWYNPMIKLLLVKDSFNLNSKNIYDSLYVYY